MESFPDRLQLALSRANLSRPQLAERLDISQSTISRWFTEGALPQRRMVAPLANVLGVSSEWLLDGSGSMQEVILYDDAPAEESSQSGTGIQQSVKEDLPVYRLSRRMNHITSTNPALHGDDFQVLFKKLLQTDTTRVLLEKAKIILSSGESANFPLAQMMLEEVQSRNESLLNQVESKPPPQ